MKNIPAIDQFSYARQTSDELRQSSLVQELFKPGKIVLNYWETDRAVLGGAVPTRAKLKLPKPRDLAAEYFNERRELGIINLGEAGSVQVDQKTHRLGHLDCLYVGRGARKVIFASASAKKPARFYLLSYPAHMAYPTTAVAHKDVEGLALGSPPEANVRTIYKYIHEEGIRSCQLVMGVTCLESGSVWNTMPPHTHLRRSEVYLYFKLPANQAVFHFMGETTQTRHLVVRDGEAVLSPPWSIHTGSGTSNYSFVWGMGGENQKFTDMDPAPIKTLR